MLTWLRIVVSCFCFVLSILFAALWVRSYYLYEALMRESGWQEMLVTANGTLAITSITFHDEIERYPDWSIVSKPPQPSGKTALSLIMPGSDHTAFGFGWGESYGVFMGDRQIGYTTKGWSVPTWFLVLATALLAYVAKPKPRWQFGLRELFVLSTIGAVTAGTLTAVLRAISS